MALNAIFWGCQIPARYPFIEKSLRRVFEELEIQIIDIDGFTCCPERALIGNMSEEVWYLTAARNLAVARKNAGKPLTLIQACNGCFSTLKKVKEDLDHDLEIRKKVNKGLGHIGLHYEGGVDVKHIVEFLHDVIGADTIKNRVKSSLNGLKIAVHPGCHMTRPSSAIEFDDPLVPKKFDQLIKSLGATNVNYPSKMLCCGGELTNIGNMDEGFAVTRQKLIETTRLNVDALAVACPNCFKQFDNQQFLMQRNGEEFEIPVFYVSELLGLALGIDPKELGLEGHRINTESFFKRWNEEKEKAGKVKEYFDLEALRKCYECRACLDDCPSVKLLDKYDPVTIMGKVLDGKIEEAMEDNAIWECLECHTCSELCPQGFGMEKVFTTLKHFAGEKGKRPAPAKKGIEMFEKTSKIGEPSKAQRKKFNLPDTPSSGFEDWKKMIEAIRSKKENEGDEILNEP
ncbi:MAG: 4Fe-4S dicluster domain-containing protein [Candidatus Schekmanbacteria bacterium]|nr:MAG: 4Fe-4S dicluster domain-containing protein [Candidatus Schekmanbacteria bacterium]